MHTCSGVSCHIEQLFHCLVACQSVSIRNISISIYSYRGPPFCLLTCAWVGVVSSSRLSRSVEREHEICGNCAVTSSRLNRWCRNCLRQVSLQVFENSDPDSFLQQRISLHFRSTLHLLITLENLTLRHFDLISPQQQFFLRIVSWDSILVDWGLWVSLDDWMHCSSALWESLSQNAEWSLTTTSTLSHFFLPLFPDTFFSTSLRDSLLSWKCCYWTNREDLSTHHVWSCLLSVCLRVDYWCQHIWFVDFEVHNDSVK